MHDLQLVNRRLANAGLTLLRLAVGVTSIEQRRNDVKFWCVYTAVAKDASNEV